MPGPPSSSVRGVSRVIVMLSMSLDGFLKGPGGDLSWHVVSDDLHRDMNAVLAASGGLLNGRRNWELMSGYWADVDPAEPEVVQDFAVVWARLPQHVFSTTLDRVEHGATLHRDLDVVPELKERADGDLYVGGGTLAAGLAERGWVDRYVLHVVPVVLGAGTPLFAPGARQALRLVSSTTWPGGVVQVRYDVVR